MAGGQPAEDGTETEVRGQVGPEVAQAEPAAAVDGERDSGEMRVRAPVRVDGGCVGEPDEGLGARGFSGRRAVEADLSRGDATDRNAVPVEDERLARVKLALRRLRQLDSLSPRHVARAVPDVTKTHTRRQ